MAFSPNGQITELVFLLEIEVCRRIDTATWTQAAAPNALCWWTPCPEGEISRIYQNGAPSLSNEGTPAGVQGEEDSWCYDTTIDPAGRIYVHLAGGAEPTDASPYLGAFHWRRYSTHAEETYDGHPYRPILDPSSIPDITEEIGGYQEGGSRFSFGTLALLNGDGHLDALLDTYIWEAKRAIVRVGERAKGDANYTVIFDGWTGNIDWSDEKVEIGTEEMKTQVS